MTTFEKSWMDSNDPWHRKFLVNKEKTPSTREERRRLVRELEALSIKIEKNRVRHLQETKRLGVLGDAVKRRLDELRRTVTDISDEV